MIERDYSIAVLAEFCEADKNTSFNTKYVNGCTFKFYRSTNGRKNSKVVEQFIGNKRIGTYDAPCNITIID